MKKSRVWFLAFLILFGCSACYWRLRNPNETPPQLKVLYLNAENVDSHFKVQLVNLLKSMEIKSVKKPQDARLSLHAYNYSLSHDNPPVSSTNVAITYTYTLTVTVSITDTQDHIVVPAHTIVTTRDVTVNVNQIFTINSTSVFQQELQREAINLIYYWLTSDQTRHFLTSSATATGNIHATPAATTNPAS